MNLAKEVQYLQSKTKSLFGSPQSISELDSFPELLQLLQYLPPKQTCDKLVSNYTTNFEKTLRILHIPSFLRQYDHFWAHPDHEIYLSSSFIPQLTAVLTVSITLGGDTLKADQYSSWEYLKINAVSLLQAWLQKLPRKHRTELATLQIETLILLARELRQISAEESWKGAGSLVRSAMVMGLHINAPEPAKMSVYQAEIRRRLWFTIAEMDLQASITSGMPTMIPQIDLQNLLPANINDSDFDEDTSELPGSRPMNEKTDSLALITLGNSLYHRIDIMNSVQHFDSRSDPQEYTQKRKILEECVADIPASLKLNEASGNNINPPVLFNQLLLDLYTRRPLLCLYRSVNMDTQDPSLKTLQQACLHSSLTILSYQDYFDPNLVDLDAQNSTEYWNMFHTICKNDIMRAALSVCEYMIATQTTDQTPSPGLPTATLPQQPLHSKASLIRTVENTLDSLSRRIGAGNNVKDIVLLSVVLQSVRGRGSAVTKQRWMMQGATKALSACRQYLLDADAESSFEVSAS